jgi:hypothetical protein
MLLFDPHYAGKLPIVARAASEIGSPIAVERVFGKSLDTIDSDLRRYLDVSSTAGSHVEVEINSDQGRIELVHPAILDARLALAEMLTNYPGRSAQASAAYAALQADYPDSAEVQSDYANWCDRLGLATAAADHRSMAATYGGK